MLHEDLFPVFVIHYLRCRRKARLSDIYVLFIVHNALRNWIVYGVTKGLEMMLHTLKKIYDYDLSLLEKSYISLLYSLAILK